MIDRPKVGVGVCVIKDGKVLLGKRLSVLGQGTWAFPGGHLEFAETAAECAQREVAEETGLQIGNIRRGPYTEDFFFAENKHYITLIMIADWRSGEPLVLEPEKCEAWGWFAFNDLPSPLFPMFANLAVNNIRLSDYL